MPLPYILVVCWSSLAFLGMKKHHPNLGFHCHMVFSLCACMPVSKFAFSIRASVILD